MRKLSITILVVTAALLVAGGVALGAIPSADETIYACYKTSSGQLRVIDDEAGDTCLPSETAISWNQEEGPEGPQGPSGLSDFEIVYATSPLASDSFVAISLPCPSGKQVISGGFDIQSPGGGVIEIVTSGPYNFGWAVRARASANFQGNMWQLAVTALCATVAP